MTAMPKLRWSSRRPFGWGRTCSTHTISKRDCFAQGKLEKAVQLYARASEVNPQDYQSPLLVAQSYEALGRPELAEAARRRGVEIVQQRLMESPDDIRAVYLGANALAALGETEKSLEAGAAGPLHGTG